MDSKVLRQVFCYLLFYLFYFFLCRLIEARCLIRLFVRLKLNIIIYSFLVR
jgi:hypothetical protein